MGDVSIYVIRKVLLDGVGIAFLSNASFLAFAPSEMIRVAFSHVKTL